MSVMRHPRLAGPPLALQIMGLLLGGLIIAQLVTLFLTMLLGFYVERLVGAVLEGHVLQFTFAARIAYRAIEGMVA